MPWELLKPSRRINENFQTHSFLLDGGKTVSGLIVEETETHLKVLENPLAGQAATVLSKARIEVRSKSPISMMPRGLLDKLTPDEILDLVLYVLARGDRNSRLFQGKHHDHGHD